MIIMKVRCSHRKMIEIKLRRAYHENMQIDGPSVLVSLAAPFALPSPSEVAIKGPSNLVAEKAFEPAKFRL
jgi:hypothetical protein